MIILVIASNNATHEAFSVALGSSLKKINVRMKVVPVAINLQVMVFAMCLFLLLFIEAAKLLLNYFYLIDSFKCVVMIHLEIYNADFGNYGAWK